VKPSVKQIDDRVEALVAHCRNAGMPMTPQRLGIYRSLLESLDHPSPETLFERVKAQLPSISLGTIYKTLDTLVSLGFASELPSVGDTKRYDANMQQHHHLVCRSCNSVEDFDDAALSAVKPPKRISGFAPEFLSIHIHGLCRRCSSQTQTGEKPWPRN
jgi:Fur family peroxide stress response transcriptional regulator